MPIYEYACDQCSEQFEQLVRSAADERDVACPKCGATRVSKRLSVFAARQGVPQAAAPPPGCGRCGDPNGMCGFDA